MILGDEGREGGDGGRVGGEPEKSRRSPRRGYTVRAPKPCRAKHSSHAARTSSQRPIRRSAGGSPSRTSGPYRFVTTRRSKRITAPTSVLLRIRRPNPCFNLSAAFGTR